MFKILIISNSESKSMFRGIWEKQKKIKKIVINSKKSYTNIRIGGTVSTVLK